MADGEAKRPGGDATSELQDRLGYRFENPDLLRTALTHRSYANERGLGEHFERLELLGDSVVGLIVTTWLYRTMPDTPEGDLSKLKSFLVSEPLLAGEAAELGLGDALLLGVGEDRSGGRSRRSLLADAFESLLGAVYLDGGLEAARDYLLPRLEQALASQGPERFSDPKTELQEILQARGLDLPEYRLVAEEGPDHRKRFHVECWLGDRKSGEGRGRTKKEAEQRAARLALEVATQDDGGESAPEREVEG